MRNYGLPELICRFHRSAPTRPEQRGVWKRGNEHLNYSLSNLLAARVAWLHADKSVVMNQTNLTFDYMKRYLNSQMPIGSQLIN